MLDPALEAAIDAAWEARAAPPTAAARAAVAACIDGLDRGTLRVASPTDDGSWQVHLVLKRAILLYFGHCPLAEVRAPPFTYRDRLPLKTDLRGVRVVPPGAARYGAHLAPGAILMPGYVNIGAYVGAGSMVDTFATVGSCAQVGAEVHLAGGVGIGGVLEPPQATPVIVEDGAFVGSRAVVVEGVRVGREAVLGAGVVLTASTPIIDVTGAEERVVRGMVPARAVVVPGVRTRQFPAGSYGLPCALIVGTRSADTDRKVSLNAALRQFEVPA